MALSLLGAKLVLVPTTYLAYLCLCVCMCGYLAADSTVDLPHHTTRSSWYHSQIPRTCPRICMSTADPDFSRYQGIRVSGYHTPYPSTACHMYGAYQLQDAAEMHRPYDAYDSPDGVCIEVGQ